MKTIILYRVIQDWRAPIFEKLSNEDKLNIEVWHGPDFAGSKIVSTKKDFFFKKTKLTSIKIQLKSKNGYIQMPFSPFLFFKLIFNNPEVIICEGASNLINSFQAFIYCKIFRKKYIWWSLGKLLNREYDNKRTKLDKIIQYIERNSNAIIAYSTRGKEYFESIGVAKEKIFVAVNVVDTKAVLEKIEKKEDIKELYSTYHQKYDFVVLFVGALIKEKEIDKLINSQKIIENNNYNIGLLIVGDGNYADELKEKAHKLEVKNIEFLGKRIEDNYKFFGAADLFVLPGLGGLAISEAMCYSLPVISSIGDGCEVDLVTSQNGVIDVDLSSEKIAQYIIDFYKNPEKVKTFGKESLNIINSGKNVEQYIKLIKDAIYH